MKKILFILFATQFILAPYIIKSYGANLIEDNYEYSGVNQGRKTVEKDIFGNIIIRDDKGNRKTIEEDIFGNITIRDDKGNRKTIEKDIFGNITIRDDKSSPGAYLLRTACRVASITRFICSTRILAIWSIQISISTISRRKFGCVASSQRSRLLILPLRKSSIISSFKWSDCTSALGTSLLSVSPIR